MHMREGARVKVSRRWLTAEGFPVLLREDNETIAYVGLPKGNTFFGKMRADLEKLGKTANSSISGIAFAGYLRELEYKHSALKEPTDLDRWWIGFIPNSDDRIGDIERRAQGLARIIAAMK